MAEGAWGDVNSSTQSAGTMPRQLHDSSGQRRRTSSSSSSSSSLSSSSDSSSPHRTTLSTACKPTGRGRETRGVEGAPERATARRAACATRQSSAAPGGTHEPGLPARGAPARPRPPPPHPPQTRCRRWAAQARPQAACPSRLRQGGSTMRGQKNAACCKVAACWLTGRPRRPSQLPHHAPAPPTWVVAKLCAGWDGRVEARHLERWVAGRRAVPLHVDQPRRRRALRHAQRVLQLRTQHAYMERGRPEEHVVRQQARSTHLRAKARARALPPPPPPPPPSSQHAHAPGRACVICASNSLPS